MIEQFYTDACVWVCVCQAKSWLAINLCWESSPGNISKCQAGLLTITWHMKTRCAIIAVIWKHLSLSLAFYITDDDKKKYLYSGKKLKASFIKKNVQYSRTPVNLGGWCTWIGRSRLDPPDTAHSWVQEEPRQIHSLNRVFFFIAVRNYGRGNSSFMLCGWIRARLVAGEILRRICQCELCMVLAHLETLLRCRYIMYQHFSC